MLSLCTEKKQPEEKSKVKAKSSEPLPALQWKSKCLEKMLVIIALVAIYKQSDNVKRNHQ